MAGSRTWVPDLPSSWKAFWLEECLPLRLAKIQEPHTSILDPVQADNEEARRLRQFGWVWAWWRLPDDLKAFWRSQG